jgi:hypothetical protein
MRKARRISWLLLLLAGLVLVSAFVTGAGDGVLRWISPTVQAAGKQIASEKSACTRSHDGPSFGKNVLVDTDEVTCGDITSFGGTVTIKGEVKGEVLAFNSQVVVFGGVDENINLYAGSLILQNGSHVQGSINLYGGRVLQNVSTHSNIHNYNWGIDWLFGMRGAFAFPYMSILMWVAVGLLLTSLLPENVIFVRTTLINRRKRSFVLGLLSMLLAPAVVIVLVALILSIPLAIIVGIGLIAAWVLGMVAIGWNVGEYILHAVTPQQKERHVQVAVGLAVLALVGSLPYIGWLINIGLGLLGLGAVLLSRFGTRLYGPPRHPLI